MQREQVTLCTVEIILCIKHTKESVKQLLELIRTLVNFPGMRSKYENGALLYSCARNSLKQKLGKCFHLK